MELDSDVVEILESSDWELSITEYYPKGFKVDRKKQKCGQQARTDMEFKQRDGNSKK